MNKLATIVVAGALAAGTLAATAGSAGAYPYYPHYRGYYGHYYGGGGDGAAVAAGIFGLTAGLIASQAFQPAYAPPPPPPYPYQGGYALSPQHVQWCSLKYKSYDYRFDSWTDYSGASHPCDAPY